MYTYNDFSHIEGCAHFMISGVLNLDMFTSKMLDCVWVVYTVFPKIFIPLYSKLRLISVIDVVITPMNPYHTFI